MNLAAYNLLNGAFFIKDSGGRYLWANNFFINQSAGMHSLGEVINKVDTDFPWHESAAQLQLHDQAVMETQQSQSYYEQIIRYDGTLVNILTNKSPFISQKKRIGVIGFSIALPSPNNLTVLSAREKECVLFLSKGYTDKKIAKQLGISPRTVETHLTAAKRKLGVKTRAELITIFYHAFSMLT